MNFKTKPLTKELWNDFEKYFEFDNKCSGCWCMNHRMPLGMEFEGLGAKLAMKQLIESNRVFGILAYIDSDPIPVGWASLDRRNTLPGHDCVGRDIQSSDSEWSIHCVTTRRDFKNKGLEKVLIESATRLAFELGATRVEGYPEPNSKSQQPYSSWNTFSGFEEDYTSLGYTKIDKPFGEQQLYYQPVQISNHNFRKS